jgi:hypothetical protein
MFKLYDKGCDLWCDFPRRLMQDFAGNATSFATYEDAEEAANEMDARGWHVQIVPA